MRRLSAIVVVCACGTAGAVPASAQDGRPRSRFLLEVFPASGQSRFGIDATAFTPRYGSHLRASVKLLRHGRVVATGVGGSYRTQIRQLPEAGDVIRFEAPPGNLIAEIAYDGTPTIPPDACAGSKVVRGRLLDANTIAARAYQLGGQDGVLISSPAGSYRVQFSKGLVLGQHLRVVEVRQTSVGGDFFTYTASTQIRVRRCAH